MSLDAGGVSKAHTRLPVGQDIKSSAIALVP